MCPHTSRTLEEIPKAKDAVDKERYKLERDRKAWDMSTARPKNEVIAESKRLGISYHLGSLMLMCHIKGLQLHSSMQTYKGRIVYRGDQTKDEDVDLAVFSAQGTGSSHLSAAKFCDAIARLPGNSGGDSDASGAYTQL